MNYKLITTMGPEGLRTYGARFVESMGRHWPGAQLEIYLHDCLGLDLPPGASYYHLESTNGWARVKQMLPDGKDGPTLAYAFKAVALAEAVRPELDWIAFVDADVEIMQNITERDLGVLFNDQYDLTYLWRKAVRESEGSWIGFNLRTPQGASLLADFYGLYVSGEFAHFRKPHDNTILDRLVAIHRAHGLRVCNLAEGALGLDAFHQSPLARFAVHYKGPQKDVIADPGALVPGRYKLLKSFVQQIVKRGLTANTFRMVEVGTWNGSRAIQMANAAFEAGAEIVVYVGYDTFDDGNDRAFEGHSKPHASEEIVRGRLENYRKVMMRSGKHFMYSLNRGDSTATLRPDGMECMDFAYIDGGHSYPTTKSDYENLKAVPYIVFDDVLNDEPGAPEGPRKVLEEITDKQIRIIRTGDPYMGLEGDIGFGLVVTPDRKLLEIQHTIEVQPKHSVDPSVQIEAIRKNSVDAEWLKPYQMHSGEALLVSAGPSLEESIPILREKWLAGATIFAVKHAMPTLMAASIYPEFVVLLDPRPPTEKSTHGIVRTELLGAISPATTALVATITNPESVARLRAEKVPMRMWHHVSGMNLGENLPELSAGLIVRGGTCAAMCMPQLATIMGFRRLTFFGYDLCYPATTEQGDIEQPLVGIRIADEPEPFLTTGELIAAMQDLQGFVGWMVEQRLSVEFVGKGAGPLTWRLMTADYKQPGEFKEDWGG